ncbi:uncharacterized protein [Malus domestica]|uniref:uncharacterized protein n=1 Tax=Malus domestica TaxID=3750 RepID=UPI003976FB1A
MELLLECHGIMGFVDGINPCPVNHSDSTESSSDLHNIDAFKIWKMHDRALMQLITATLSPTAISCAIGNTSAQDLWMKSELQNIKKGIDYISLYLQRIKEARDYLVAAGVLFADDDTVILTLNGMSSEYNTLRSIIRGRENVISMKDLRSQLLAEEAMLANVPVTPFISVMVASNLSAASKLPHFESNSTRPHYSSNGSSSNGGSYSSQGSFYQSNGSGSKSNYNNNKGKGKYHYNSRFGNAKPGSFHNNAPGILGASPPKAQGFF